MNTDVQSLIREARTLLARLNSEQAPDAAAADDLLLLLYRLRDGYRIVRSSNMQFHGPAFASLNGLLYELESKPQQTMRSQEWRSMIENLLRALVTGAVVIESAQASRQRSQPS
jgi:hypothetical protein